jgi:amidohydrolase family protein
MKNYLALLLLATSLQLHAQMPSESVITHVTVVDVLTGTEMKDQTVKLHGEQIMSISPTSSSAATSGEALDAQGGFLIPGLWDMHVHIHDTDELLLYVANGVTGIRIMSGNKDDRALRAELSQQTVSPQIYLASAIVDGPSPIWPGSIVVKKPEDARRAVDQIKDSGADFIKVYSGVPRKAYFALAGEAKKELIPFEGHLPEEITAQEASAAGQRSLEHLNGIGVSCSNRQERLTSDLVQAPFFRQKLVVEGKAYQSVDPAKCEQLFAEFRKNDTWQVPTLTVNRIWGTLDARSTTHDPRLKYISKDSRNHWDDRIAPIVSRWSPDEFGLARGVFSADEKIVSLMYRAGVPMMAGTDAMNPFCFPGFSLHDELALLVESGLSPLAALQSATINPAKFLGRLAEEGSISPGKAANLVLLDADPLVDIHNTTHIQAVWLAGHYYGRQKLSVMLDTVQHNANR